MSNKPIEVARSRKFLREKFGTWNVIDSTVGGVFLHNGEQELGYGKNEDEAILSAISRLKSSATLPSAADLDAHAEEHGKPWRKTVMPSGPWKLRWYGSGDDRGYHLFDHSKGGNNGERIAFLGDQISSDDANDIPWAHNVAAAAALPALPVAQEDAFEAWLQSSYLKVMPAGHMGVKMARAACLACAAHMGREGL